MTTITYDECLAHYGIKGMKWGVRKDPDRPSNSVDRRTAKYMNRGMSQADAEKKAARKAKQIKAFIAIAGVVAVSAAVYSTYHYIGKQYTPVLLEKGLMLCSS